MNRLDIRYMITGAVAAVIYGEPRFTRDLDLVLDLRPADAVRLADAFPRGSLLTSFLEHRADQAGLEVEAALLQSFQQ